MSERDQAGNGELVRRMKEGDESAFHALYELHADRMQAVAREQLWRRLRRKVSVSDVVQDARIVAFERRREFEGGDAVAFGRWLLTLTERKTREAVRHFGRARRDARREVTRGGRQDTADFQGVGATPSEAAIDAERRGFVRQAVAKLSFDHREVLTLVFEDRLTLRETARRMERSREAAKKLYGRALIRFREEYRQVAGRDQK